MRCLKKFEPQTKKKGIHATAIIESRKIGKDVYIGAYCYIGKNVSIGDNTTIFGHVHIYDNCIIGNNVIINSSSVIGADGFGYEKNEKGEWEYYSKNTKTGKVVRVNMEEMIKDIEKLTGKKYIKDE